MNIKVRFSIDKLPSKVQKELQSKLQDGAGNVFIDCPEYGYLIYDAVMHAVTMSVGDNTEDQVLDFCRRANDMIVGISLCEHAYLDDKAIVPTRGIYNRGESNAIVDSYIDSNGDRSFPIWKICVDGASARSVFDLFHLIRQGKVEPTEWWDKKPEAVINNCDKR